jgi:hypothetical protein
MSLKSGIWLVVTCVMARSASMEGQATQAAAGLADRRAAAMRDTLEVYRQRALSLASALRERESGLRRGGSPSDDAWLVAVARAASVAEAVWRQSPEDRDLLQSLRAIDHVMRDLGEAESRFNQRTDSIAQHLRERAPREGQVLTTTGWTPTPAFLHTLQPNVAFSAGIGSTFPLFRSTTASIDVGTNLVGSALGAAIGSLGAPDALKGYFTQNLAMGLNLSAHRKRSIGVGYSLGLGSLDVADRAVWPVIAMQQTDTMAQDLPAALRQRKPAQETWSTPHFAVGFTLLTRESVTKRLQEGRAFPVFTLGVSLPYFYPGDPGAAFAALFTGKHTRYIGANHSRLVLGVSVPLIRLEKPPAGKP